MKLYFTATLNLVSYNAKKRIGHLKRSPKKSFLSKQNGGNIFYQFIMYFEEKHFHIENDASATLF